VRVALSHRAKGARRLGRIERSSLSPGTERHNAARNRATQAPECKPPFHTVRLVLHAPQQCCRLTLDRFPSQVEQARQLEALESSAQDVSSEAQLALLVAQNRSEQQRILLQEAKKLLDQKSAENQRLQRELDTAIHVIPNRHAKVCGQGDVSACERQRLRTEVQALRGALEAERVNKSGSRAYEHESHSESFESQSGAENNLSSFLRRAQEKRRKFKDSMIKLASCDSRGSPHNLQEPPELNQQNTSTEVPRKTAPGRGDNTYIQSEASGRGYSPTLLEVSVLVQDLVAVCKAHKCEAEDSTQELSAQSARYNDVLQELAEYKQVTTAELVLECGRTHVSR